MWFIVKGKLQVSIYDIIKVGPVFGVITAYQTCQCFMYIISFKPHSGLWGKYSGASFVESKVIRRERSWEADSETRFILFQSSSSWELQLHLSEGEQFRVMLTRVGEKCQIISYLLCKVFFCDSTLWEFWYTSVRCLSAIEGASMLIL